MDRAGHGARPVAHHREIGGRRAPAGLCAGVPWRGPGASDGVLRGAGHFVLGAPARCPFIVSFLGGGLDYRKKGTLILTSLLSKWLVAMVNPLTMVVSLLSGLRPCY